jgi:cell wall-associated NlpC family hydrolase
MPRVYALLVFLCLLLFPATAAAETPSAGGTGGAQFPEPAPIVAAGAKATLLPDGTAAAPAEAPPEIQAAIFAANKLLDKPYKYGGGHAKVEDSGYDCSGTVSYALLGAGLLKSPLDSGSFMRWGAKGKGTWFTVYTNPGHAFAMIAGLRLDTSAYGVSAKVTRKIARVGERGPRWRAGKRPKRGFKARHPVGF